MNRHRNVKSPARLGPILGLGMLVAVLAVFSPLGMFSLPETRQSSQEPVDRPIASPIEESASFSAYFIHIRYDNWSAIAVPGIQARDGTATNPHVIENFTINAGTSPTGSGIFIEHSKQHFIIRNCKITNASTTSNTAGIKLLNVTNGQLVGNNCSRNRYAGILLMTNCDYNIIQGNIAFDNQYFGILLNGQCDRNIIQGNTASCTPSPTPPQDYGIELVSSCMWNNITENTVNNNLQYGIRIAGICNYNRITNNHAEANQYTGIGVESSNNVIVAHNTVTQNVVLGIHHSITTGSTIEANVVSFSPWSIVVESYYGSFVSDHNTIADNIIDESGCGILIDNSDNDTISSNTITNSVIGIRSTRTEYSSITRNHIMGNGTVDIGICINATSEFHNVTGNTIDNYSTGIKLYNLVTACHITSNEISGCSEYGIFMNQSSTSAVSNNIIRDSGIAIRVFLGNGTFVSENIITGSTTGVLLNSSVGTYVLSNRIVVSGSCIAVDRHCPFTTLSGNVCGEGGSPDDQPGLDAFVLAYAVVVTAALIVVILSWNMKTRKKH